LSKYLSGLSTFGRFLRFVKDFRKKEGYTLKYEVKDYDKRNLIYLSLRDATEFITKKDYIDNWMSEMHETFAFWSFSEWHDEVQKAGFEVSAESIAFSNPWIIEHRFKN